MNQDPAPQLPIIIIPPIMPPKGEVWKFAKRSQDKMPPNMMITPEARDNANPVGDPLLLSLVADVMCKI
jgi:hypothetical protein